MNIIPHLNLKSDLVARLVSLLCLYGHLPFCIFVHIKNSNSIEHFDDSENYEFDIND